MNVLQSQLGTNVVDTFNPTGTILAGQPVSFAGALAAAAAVGILGIATEDCVSTDTACGVLLTGKCQATGSALIAAGTRLKVAADGKFAAISGTDLADGKAVAVALTGCGADGETFDIFVFKS